jgi:rfaE bifunctional protein kinase chain/domain
MSERLRNLFDEFNTKNVLIIGDVMIDSYIWGKVDRISPEAPVPIINVKKREDRLGGAANVALNIKSLGANAILCSVVGEDKNADLFYDLLAQDQLSAQGIIRCDKRITTKKTRVIGHHQQLFRVDEELDITIDSETSNKLIDTFNNIVNNQKIDVIIFEDYDKGVLNEQVIKTIIAKAKALNIQVVVDPKKRNFFSYNDVDLFKPNLKELKEGMKIDFDVLDKDALINAANALKNKINANNVMITLSEHGVLVCEGNSNKIIPAHIRNISDVSGAGDTVISVIALALASNMSVLEAAELANLAGGLVCEKVGVVPINKTELLNEAMQLENM